jgi:hypothetical protein
MNTGFGTVFGGTAKVHPSSLLCETDEKKAMVKLLRENAE